ncbi:uncharacterized protein LOC127152923 isoform X1 [Labeo rohita]|uniref:uncharacterized protein LOC127152923 isoform X1 n=1 Tax=Labeo rohita TaxID=84645 RepID=UPI0021E1D253|nr:uncharacterized protein LOC127152923 isoform X1 [Labeo rohita]
MRLHWHLSFASMCLYVWGETFQTDHHIEKWNHCEGHFYKAWTHLQLLIKKASVDYCCRCHEEKCISIAIFPALKHVPVFWAYKISHKGVPDLSEHELLKNITTWYISPMVVEDLLRGKLHSLPPQVTSRPSPSTTHILSGVFHLNAKYIRWITYHHTDTKGLTFEGALVQKSKEKCKWKWLTVKQLVGFLSDIFLTKPMQTLFDYQNTGPLNLNGLDEIPDIVSVGKKIEDYLDTAMPCVITTTMQIKEAERDFSKVTTSSKPPLTSDMIAGLCSVLIHRTSTGLKRCLERMILDKENYTTSSPLLYLSGSNKPRNVRSDLQKQSSQSQLNEIINHRKSTTQKPHNRELSAEENYHFYYFNGKIRRTMNHFGYGV